MYTCPMHPQIMEPNPGTCPICGMDLVPVSQTQTEAGIMLSENQMQLANIRTQEVGYGNIGNTTILTGATVANQNLAAQVSSRAAGRIERLYVRAEGEQIKKGDPLYDLYSERLLTLQQEYLLALAQQETLGSAERNYDQILQAAKESLLLYGVSERQIKQIARQGKPMTAITFFSEQAGVVEEIAVTEGQYISEGSPLFRLTDLSTLWVEAQMYPSELAMVQIGDSVDIRLSGYGAGPVRGKVVFLAPELQAGSRITLLRAVLANPGRRFQPGMQATVTLTGNTRRALSLPIDAVIRDGQGSYVWQKTAEGTFVPVMVTVGSESATTAEITAGLSEGDEVVVSGAYLLHSENVLKKGGDPMAGMDM
jgi:Cu(I)/Ag(I) efflux system membrane fusion protein